MLRTSDCHNEGVFPCQLVMNKGFSFYRNSGATLEGKSNTRIWCQTSSEGYNYKNIGECKREMKIFAI